MICTTTQNPLCTNPQNSKITVFFPPKITVFFPPPPTISPSFPLSSLLFSPKKNRGKKINSNYKILRVSAASVKERRWSEPRMADSRRRTQRRREKQRRRLEWRLLVCNATPAGEAATAAGTLQNPRTKNPRSLLAGSSTSLDTEEIYFDFTKQRYIYSQEKNTFCKLPYPSKETIGYYLKSTAYGTEAKIVAATEKWGRNVFEYPQPTFQRLMKEQIMEPFLVFQVFCVGLWCLDEYWYYSLFTLFMLFMFESTMAQSRLKTLSELRRIKVDSQTFMVHRCGSGLNSLGQNFYLVMSCLLDALLV
ncbi:putative manganese-transporting ATPase PDR2 [Sesamum alatum]|uniref:Manganese-transporting ATPase PDR2 n=1 Tax=Sesamum alatum TaxID=300844 RepID=A0AAE1XJ63_9LAMI|nr:putative manganese-transporting ATPase PDR2 [Sesamum alatum]